MRRKFIIITTIIILLLFVFLAILYSYRCDDRKSLIVPTITRLETEEKVVALTFDDGPSEQKTSTLLDLFEEEDVQATFFVIGENVEKYPEIIERMNQNGHLIANHSYSHKRLIFQWPWVVREEIDKTDIALQELQIPVSKYFRPPYLDEMLILPLILNEKEKVIISYNVDPVAKYNSDFDANVVSTYVVENVTPGSIVVLHDGTDKNISEFIKAINDIIIQLKEKGYSFVTVDY
jgi:peptidoglycan/xylan/chitin deacetylase (PgdA/CDA1 family)